MLKKNINELLEELNDLETINVLDKNSTTTTLFYSNLPKFSEIIKDCWRTSFEIRQDILMKEFEIPLEVTSNMNSVRVLDQNIMAQNRITAFALNAFIEIGKVLKLSEVKPGKDSLLAAFEEVGGLNSEIFNLILKIEVIMSDYEKLNANNNVTKNFRMNWKLQETLKQYLKNDISNMVILKYFETIYVLLADVIKELGNNVVKLGLEIWKDED